MKKFGKILAMVMVALMMMSVVAMAEEAEKPAMGDPVINEKVVTVQLTGLTANEEATILVVNDIRIVEDEEVEVTLSDLKNTDIVYIDQLTVDDKGTVTFTLDASNAVANSAGKQLVNIYCGYTNMDVAAGPMTLADVDINPVTAPEVEYGNLDGDEIVSVNDAIIVLKIAMKSIEGTEAQMLAANVDTDAIVSVNDAILVLKKAMKSIDSFPIEEMN